jgi:hypothetical protein
MVYEAGAGPARELAGRPQPGRSALSKPESVFGITPPGRIAGAIDLLAGGDPGAARMNWLANRGDEAVADLFAVPIAGLLIERGLHFVPGMKPVSEAVGSTRKSQAAMMSLMGNELLHVGPEEMTSRLAALGDIWKQAARESGITDANIHEVMPSRALFTGNKEYLDAVTRGNQTALNIARKAVDIAGKPLDTLIETYGKRPAGNLGSRIAAALERDAADTVDEGVAGALRKLADKARNARTIEDLNEIKKHANKEADKLYSAGTTGKAVNASAQTVYAYKLAAEAIRDELYPRLRDLSGNSTQFDIIAFGKREADAIALRDGMETAYRDMQLEQANKEVLSFGQYLFGEGREHSLYSRHVARRAAEKLSVVPGPTGMFNFFAKKATGELGEKAIGERVQRGAVRQKALPPIGGFGGVPGEGTFFFDIPAGMPTEVISPVTITERMSYEGATDLPALGHEPMDRTTFRQHEPGPGPGAYEDRPLASKARRQEIGSLGGITPERSFTGPRTVKGTRWQRIVGAEGGDVARGGGGVMRTFDVATAQATLDRLSEYIRNHPSEAPALSAAADQLTRQIADYHAYAGATPPVAVRVRPGLPGIARRSRVGRRVAAVAGATQAGEAEARRRERKKFPPL